jgi:hypothetical protein
MLIGGLALGSSALAIAGSKTKPHEDNKAQGAQGEWKTAQLTTYTSYPACCEGSPAFDPNADTSECDDFSGCEFQGDFASLGHQSFEFVQENSIVAFYDNADKTGKDFNKNYGGKKIKLRKNGKEFTAVIADTCGNADCDDCCIQNSKGGFLVDAEFWTAERSLGGADQAEGTIEFQIVD